MSSGCVIGAPGSTRQQPTRSSSYLPCATCLADTAERRCSKQVVVAPGPVLVPNPTARGPLLGLLLQKMLTAVHELLQSDARLLELKLHAQVGVSGAPHARGCHTRTSLVGLSITKLFMLHAQARIVATRGSQGCSSEGVDLHTRNLVAGLTDSSVLRTQQKAAQQHQQPNHAPHAAAVLEVVVQHWQRLMQGRLDAAQMLLPDVPLVSAARTAEQQQVLQATGGVHPSALRCNCSYIKAPTFADPAPCASCLLHCNWPPNAWQAMMTARGGGR